MWHDSVQTFYGVLESTYVRLVLFVATILVGGLVGCGLAGTAVMMSAGGTTFYIALWSSLVTLAVLLERIGPRRLPGLGRKLHRLVLDRRHFDGRPRPLVTDF